MEKSKNVDLTNACSVISRELALQFLSGTIRLDKATLERIFAASAPKMRLMRERLGMDPDAYEQLDLDEIMDNIEQWYIDDKKAVQSTFPTHKEEHFLVWQTFGGPVTMEAVFLDIQTLVEAQLASKVKVAVTIWFRYHFITGCFDREVRSPRVPFASCPQ